MKKNDKIISNISEIMKKVTPKEFFRDYKLYPENRRTLFEIICNRACLDPNSFDVMRAFEQCFNK